MERRKFMKSAAAAAAVTGLTTDTGWAVPAGDEYELEHRTSNSDILAACPYCGVGCGTIIQTQNGRITNIVPDKDHPTNKGLQCIKELTSAEAIYVDRFTKPLIRKDMSDPLRGHVSATKGSYDRDLFREASWEGGGRIGRRPHRRDCQSLRWQRRRPVWLRPTHGRGAMAGERLHEGSHRVQYD